MKSGIVIDWEDMFRPIYEAGQLDTYVEALRTALNPEHSSIQIVAAAPFVDPQISLGLAHLIFGQLSAKTQYEVCLTGDLSFGDPRYPRHETYTNIFGASKPFDPVIEVKFISADAGGCVRNKLPYGFWGNILTRSFGIDIPFESKDRPLDELVQNMHHAADCELRCHDQFVQLTILREAGPTTHTITCKTA